MATGCAEGDGARGALEGAAMDDGARRVPFVDEASDPAVTLLAWDGGAPDEASGEPDEEPPMSESPGESDAGVAPVSPEREPAPDAEPVEADAGSREPDAGNTQPEEPTEPEDPTEPDPPGGGGLVGTVCDLLGGLLCPVGLLCVDGLCQRAD